jgi:hypothetical protein
MLLLLLLLLLLLRNLLLYPLPGLISHVDQLHMAARHQEHELVCI